MAFKKNAAATPPHFSTTCLIDKYIKLISFLFCDTTDGQAIYTQPAKVSYTHIKTEN